MELQKFDPQKMWDASGGAPTSIIIGQSRAGKSCLIRDLCWYWRDVPMVFVMSYEEYGCGFYKKFIPEICISSIYNDYYTEKILKSQTKVQKTSTLDTRSVVVLDDVLYESNIRKQGDWFSKLFLNGRKMNICTIIASQWPTWSNPTVCSNLDYVFIGRDKANNTRERLYKYYCGRPFPEFEIFIQLLEKYANGVGDYLVIDNTIKSEKWEDRLYWYHSEMRDNFKIGSAQLWELSYKRMAELQKDTVAAPSTINVKRHNHTCKNTCINILCAALRFLRLI